MCNDRGIVIGLKDVSHIVGRTDEGKPRMYEYAERTQAKSRGKAESCSDRFSFFKFELFGKLRFPE